MINKKIINIRKSLDKLDDKFLKLIKKRTSLVNEIVKNKKFKKDIVDKKRINIILKNIKKKSISRKIDYKITEKQVKCLIKETKPLVKKDEWNKYIEMWNARANGQDKMDNNNMESLMNVGIAMIGIGQKCNVTF